MDRPAVLYAISDVHGGYSHLVTLLAANRLIESAPASAGEVRWSAGQAILIVVGDLIDKGPQSWECLALFQALQEDAVAKGGQVVVLFGNHEAEFLADPYNGKTAGNGLGTELEGMGIDPMAVGDGTDPRGSWMRGWPFAARVGDWFFVHAGDTRGRSIAQVEDAVRADVEAYDYRGQETTASQSLLEARGAFDADPQAGAGDAAALGVRHIVFGHDPNALGKSGSIAVGADGTLFRIDCDMAPDGGNRKGEILRVTSDAGIETVDALDHKAKVRRLWAGRPGGAP